MTASRALVRSPMGADTRKFANLELRGLKRDGSFSGYASVFGEVDPGKDAIERGAFRKSLAERGACGVRMLFQHDPAEPIGAWKTIREDSRGLFVEGMLAEGVARAREVHQLLKRGALDGLSIGFRTVRAKTDAKSGVRRIFEADLWEISVVTFPMLPSARVQALLDDAAVDIEAWISSEVDTVFAEQEGTAFVNGDGTSKPKGFLAYTTVADSAWSWGNLGYIATGAAGAFKTTGASDTLIDTIYSLKAGHRPNANFVMNRKTQAEVRKLKDGDGRYLWQPPATAGEAASLVGFPVVEAEDMPDIAAIALSIAFGDFRAGYLVVDRTGVRAARSLCRQALRALLHNQASRRRSAEFRGDQAHQVRRELIGARRVRPLSVSACRICLHQTNPRSSMTFALITPPSAEALTLAEVKAHLRLDDGSEDALLASLISVAREHPERTTGLCLITQVWRLHLESLPEDRVIQIAKGPVQAVESLSIYDEVGEEVVLPAAGHVLDGTARPARLCWLET